MVRTLKALLQADCYYFLNVTQWECVTLEDY